MQIMSIVAHEAHWMLEGINLYTGEVLEHVPAGSSHFETFLVGISVTLRGWNELFVEIG